MDKQLLRVLIVDESPDDAERVTDLLRNAGYMLKTQRVQDVGGVQTEIAKGQWDLVISEYQINRYKAAHALDALKRDGQDIPVVVLTRAISDDDIARILRAGARDVIIKDQMARLAPVVERELAALRTRAALKQTEAALKELEDKHRSLIETSREAICYSQDGMHLDANRAYLALFGYDDLSEIEGIPFLNLVDRADHKQIKDYFRRAGGNAALAPLAFDAVNRQGQRFHAEISISTININGERCQQIVVSDISKRKAAEQKLLYMSQHDAMTGLYNRHHFLQELGKAVEQAQAGKGDGALLYVDVDQMHGINDEFGLEAGDRVLLRLAKLFREKLRPEDVLARLGGDEFGILMPGLAPAEAQAVADDLSKALTATPIQENGKNRACTCSMKIIAIDARTGSVQKILSQTSARRAVAASRQPQASVPEEAKTPTPAAEPASAEASTNVKPLRPAGGQNMWHKRIESALDEGKLHVVFQPIVSLHAEPAEYYEVLVRLGNEGDEAIVAGEFMAAAEQSGQAQQIDRAVLQRVMDKLQGLQQKAKATTFFVNVSACALRDPGFLTFLADRLKQTGANGHFLVFEINAADIGQHPQEIGNFIRIVKRLGCDLAIDNFTPANAQYVQQQPITYLKINGELVGDLGDEPAAQATMRTISGLAKTLGKRMIAKSVESAESLSLLWRYEIDYVQGHYFQAPLGQLSYDFNVESISSDEAVGASWIPVR